MKAPMLLALAVLPISASGDFFFMVNDAMQTKCIETPITTADAAAKMVENSTTMTCSSVTDKDGNYMLKCEGLVTTYYYFTKDLPTCEMVAKTLKDLSG